MDLLDELRQILEAEATALGADLPATGKLGIIERPRNPSHGDFASGLAMRIAKQLGKPPREIAARLAGAVQGHEAVDSTEVAGPGFVNIKLSPVARCSIVKEALSQKERFGSSEQQQMNTLLEPVSANPTGPLHVGHGRAAAIGDSIARILRFVGARVDTEYYLNDRGLQTDVLAASLWLRILKEKGLLEQDMPEGTYSGDYLARVAQDFIAAHPTVDFTKPDLPTLPDKPDEVAVTIAAEAKKTLGAEFQILRAFAIESMVKMIRGELEDFGVPHDNWTSEQRLFDDGTAKEVIDKLKRRGCVYEKDGALWFRQPEGSEDDKDRVLIRSNGEHTYFGADAAYHLDKVRRGYESLYIMVGSDHHGYKPRLEAMLQALDIDPAILHIVFVQFVSLVNADGRIKMSTRQGNFLPLSELLESVGKSAARLFFVMSRADVPMDFDVAKAMSASNENPVYYIQYAHARCCSLLERWGGDVKSLGDFDASLLTEDEANAVMTELRWFATTVLTAASEFSPHRIAHWLVALASALHGFYDRVPILSGDSEAIEGRLALVAATRQALANGMGLIGVEAPNKM